MIASRPQPGGFVEETPGSSGMRRMSVAVLEVRSACASGWTGHLKDPVVQPCVAMGRLIRRPIRNVLEPLWNFGAGGEDRTPDLRFTKPLHYRCATPARDTLATSRGAAAQAEPGQDPGSVARNALAPRVADQGLEALVGPVDALGDAAADAFVH